jgi:hypothetical protein
LFLSFILKYDIPAPKIKFEYIVHNRGDIGEGSDGLFFFPLENVGNTDLLIASVRSSCGCLAPRFNMRPVAPGERDTVFALYDTKRIGPINKTLVVATNELEHDKRIILRVAGRVLPYKMDEIQVRYQDSITLSFSEYNKAEIGVFGKTEFTLEFLNTSNDTLKIFASSRGPDLFNVIDDEFEILPGKSRSVRVKRNDKVKHFYGTIHFSLSNKKYFTIDVLK